MFLATNLALRFVLEVAGVLALGYWGFAVGQNLAMRLALGLGGPLVLVAFWAVVVAPGASNPLPPLARTMLGTVLLEATALALFAAGRSALGIAFAILIVVNAALLVVLEH